MRGIRDRREHSAARQAGTALGPADRCQLVSVAPHHEHRPRESNRVRSQRRHHQVDGEEHDDRADHDRPVEGSDLQQHELCTDCLPLA